MFNVKLIHKADLTVYLGTFDKKIIENFPVIQETTPSAIPGAYEIKTGTDFPVPNNTYLVGLAKVNNRGQVAPVASVRLSPDSSWRLITCRILDCPKE